MSHSHASSVAHQFDDAAQQKESVTLGMWLFLATEIMFFGGLFLGYSIYRSHYPAGFAFASHHLDIALGGFNTVVLILSSLTMAMAVHSAEIAKKKSLLFYLVTTLGLGALFLGVKVIEYSHKFHAHLIPGPHFALKGTAAAPMGAEMFYCFYFAMTGMHAVHMILGAVVLIALIGMTVRGKITEQYHSPIEMFGLYWHFVDIIWIFLFPLLYLIGRHA